MVVRSTSLPDFSSISQQPGGSPAFSRPPQPERDDVPDVPAPQPPAPQPPAPQPLDRTVEHFKNDKAEKEDDKKDDEKKISKKRSLAILTITTAAAALAIFGVGVVGFMTASLITGSSLWVVPISIVLAGGAFAGAGLGVFYRNQIIDGVDALIKKISRLFKKKTEA
ncbi:MAG: hypothetical protein VX777_08225 [Chlamydiota bacterium]|nr:hypothetical protein [Chlamydiota bacterium]